ncbi:hypothetical protein Gotri_012722, partial [Gossypium trilobum]|nr:hypothetical protein [Gossypium trilobum]
MSKFPTLGIYSEFATRAILKVCHEGIPNGVFHKGIFFPDVFMIWIFLDSYYVRFAHHCPGTHREPYWELSIPCKLVLNVIRIKKTEALAVLKSVVCVSRFDSYSKFNLLKVVSILPISKKCLGGILSGMLNIILIVPSWCWEISLSEVFLIGVGAIGSVAPSSFQLSG